MLDYFNDICLGSSRCIVRKTHLQAKAGWKEADEMRDMAAIIKSLTGSVLMFLIVGRKHL